MAEIQLDSGIPTVALADVGIPTGLRCNDGHPLYVVREGWAVCRVDDGMCIGEAAYFVWMFAPKSVKLPAPRVIVGETYHASLVSAGLTLEQALAFIDRAPHWQSQREHAS